MVLVIFLVILALPLILIISLLIASDGGPMIYTHRRVGLDGMEFSNLKFRTMYTRADAVLAAVLEADPAKRAEWQTAQKLRKDPRVACIGHFLRTTSLDELPQFFNVSRGDMSLVGPRPVTVEELELYYAGFSPAARTACRSVQALLAPGR